jgi:hypothetical protein
MIVLPAVAFALLCLSTEDRALILTLNIVQASFATTVIVAFLPEVGRILFTREPMARASWLIYGIWISWVAVDYRTGLSLTWRLLGQPAWLVNSDFTSAYLFMGALGAMSHIIRPGGLEARIPSREWIKIGLIAGLSVAVAGGLVWGHDIVETWRAKRVSMFRPHDTAVAGPAPAAYSKSHDLMPDVFAEIAPPQHDLSSRVEARVPEALADRLENWRSAQRPIPNKSEAVRRLLDEALDAEDKAAAEPFEPEGR